MKTIIVSVLSLAIGLGIGSQINKTPRIVDSNLPCKLDISEARKIHFSLSPNEQFTKGDSVCLYYVNGKNLTLSHTLFIGESKNSINLLVN